MEKWLNLTGTYNPQLSIGFSGADITVLVNEPGVLAIKDASNNYWPLKTEYLYVNGPQMTLNSGTFPHDILTSPLQSAHLSWTLPPDAGIIHQTLGTNGLGILGWVDRLATVTLTGDASGVSTGAPDATLPLTLNTVNLDTGTWGGPGLTPVLTVNEKGLTTAASEVPTETAWGNITGTLEDQTDLSDTFDQVALAFGYTGVTQYTDTVLLVALNDTTLRILPLQEGLFYNEIASSSFRGAMRAFPQLDIALSTITLPADGLYIRYVSYNSAGAVSFTPNSTALDPNFIMLGIVFIKRVAGVNSFTNGAAGPRNVLTYPDMAGNNGFVKTFLVFESNVSIVPNALKTVRNLPGFIKGENIAWHTATPHEKPVAAANPASFITLNPGTAALVAFPAAGTAVQTTQYWNGAAMVSTGSPNTASVQRFIITSTGGLVLQVGEATYSNLGNAAQGMSTAPFTNIFPGLDLVVEIARFAVRNGATNLNDIGDAVFRQAGGLGGGSSVGAAGTVTSVNLASPTATLSTVGGPITTAGTINVDLIPTGVTPDTYMTANVTVDQYGLVTFAEDGFAQWGTIQGDINDQLDLVDKFVDVAGDTMTGTLHFAITGNIDNNTSILLAEPDATTSPELQIFGGVWDTDFDTSIPDSGVRIGGSYVAIEATDISLKLNSAQPGSRVIVAGLTERGNAILGVEPPPIPDYIESVTGTTDVDIYLGGGLPGPWVQVSDLGTITQDIPASGGSISFELLVENPGSKPGEFEIGVSLNGLDPTPINSIAYTISNGVKQLYANTSTNSLFIPNGTTFQLYARGRNGQNGFKAIARNSERPSLLKVTVLGSGGGGGGTVWGTITGDISNQTDLQDAFVNVTGDTMTGALNFNWINPNLGFLDPNYNSIITLTPYSDAANSPPELQLYGGYLATNPAFNQPTNGVRIGGQYVVLDGNEVGINLPTATRGSRMVTAGLNEATSVLGIEPAQPPDYSVYSQGPDNTVIYVENVTPLNTWVQLTTPQIINRQIDFERGCFNYSVTIENLGTTSGKIEIGVGLNEDPPGSQAIFQYSIGPLGRRTFIYSFVYATIIEADSTFRLYARVVQSNGDFNVQVKPFAGSPNVEFRWFDLGTPVSSIGDALKYHVVKLGAFEQQWELDPLLPGAFQFTHPGFSAQKILEIKPYSVKVGTFGLPVEFTSVYDQNYLTVDFQGISLNTATTSFKIDSTGALNLDNNPGNMGAVLTSQGFGLPPVWIGGSGSGTPISNLGDALNNNTVNFGDFTQTWELNSSFSMSGLHIKTPGFYGNAGVMFEGGPNSFNPTFAVYTENLTQTLLRVGGVSGGQGVEVGDGANPTEFRVSNQNATLTVNNNGISFTTPTSLFEITSDGAYQLNGDPGTIGQVVTSQGPGAQPIWTTVGGGGGGGSVTSVNIVGNDGIVVTGGPITTSGSFTLDLGNITPNNVASTTAMTQAGITVLDANSTIFGGTY